MMKKNKSGFSNTFVIVMTQKQKLEHSSFRDLVLDQLKDKAKRFIVSVVVPLVLASIASNPLGWVIGVCVCVVVVAVCAALIFRFRREVAAFLQRLSSRVVAGVESMDQSGFSGTVRAALLPVARTAADAANAMAVFCGPPENVTPRSEWGVLLVFALGYMCLLGVFIFVW